MQRRNRKQKPRNSKQIRESLPQRPGRLAADFPRALPYTDYEWPGQAPLQEEPCWVTWKNRPLIVVFSACFVCVAGTAMLFQDYVLPVQTALLQQQLSEAEKRADEANSLKAALEVLQKNQSSGVDDRKDEPPLSRPP